MTPFVVDWREIVERGMAAVGVVPSLDEIKDRDARLGLGLEAPPAEQFAFQGGEETLAHGVVEAVAHGSHRRPHSGLLAALAEGERNVLAALVGMMDHAGRASLPERHVERIWRQLGAQMGLHRPAHDTADTVDGFPALGVLLLRFSPTPSSKPGQVQSPMLHRRRTSILNSETRH